MGKSFKGFQRHLSVILTIAMILTMMPTTAYADELIGGDSEDILISDEVISDEVISDETVIEEESDALISDDVDTLISDDDSSIDIRKDSSSVADDAEDILDGNTAGEEDIDQDKSTGDVKISLSNNSATTNVKIFDPDSANGDEPYSSPVAWDSTRDFTFTLTPEDGYVLDPDKFKEIKITVVSENGVDVIETIAKVAGGYTYDTASGEVTIKKEALGTYKTQGNFKAEIPVGMAKADTYNVTVVGAKVEDEKSLTVSYNGTADISISADDLNTPITDVKVYTKYDPDDPEKCVSVNSSAYDFDNSHKPVSTNVVVKLKAAATQAGYTDKGLTIVAECDKFNITQGADSYGNELKFYQDGKVITSSGYFDKDITVSLNAAAGVTGRALDSVEVVVTYKGDTKPRTFSIIKEATKSDITADIPACRLVYDNKKAVSLTVTCVTKEVIDITNVDTEKVTISGLPTGDKKYVETGKDLSFKVEPKDARYIIGDVGYKSGNSSETTKLGKGTGEYKIEDVRNKVAIVVEVIEATKDTPVALKDSDPEFEVTDSETGIAVSTNALGFAEAGKDYFFTVTSDKGKAIGSVKYTIDGISADAQHVEGDKYKIPADRNSGYIYICVKAQAKLVEVKNNNAGKASIYVGSEAKKVSFYVNDNEDLTFTVKPAKNNITLDKVSYKVGTASANVVKKAADGSYAVTIKKNDLNGTVEVNTETTEIADASTYDLTFNPDGNSAYKKGEDGKDIKPANLRLALTDSTVLTPVLKNKKGHVIQASNRKAEYEPESKGAIVSVNEIANAITLSANGKAKGSDVINAKLTLSENGNKTIYSGQLNVTVEDHYKVTLNVAPEDPIFVDKELAKVSGTQNLINAVNEEDNFCKATVTATVSNNVTNAAIDNNKVIVKWSSDNGDFAINKTSDWKKLDAEGALTTVVAAKAAGESNVNVIIKDVDGTEYEAEAVTVKAIEEPAINLSNSVVYATIKFDGDKEEQLLSENEVELVASTRKSATVKARVVKIEDLSKVNKNTFKSLVSINAALKAETITDVTDNEVITLGYKNLTPAADYYSIKETGKGEWKVSITDKGDPIEVQLTLAIKDVLPEKEVGGVTFRALKSNAKAQIGIALNDGNKEVTLPATYLEGKDYTTGYDDNPDNAGDGFCFKAEGNTEFVLPEVADNANKTRALIGWQCVSINNVKEADVKAYYRSIYKAGESFKVPVPSYTGTYKAATMTIKPIWADRVVNTVSKNTPYAVSEMFRMTLSNNEAASLEVSENRIFKVNEDDETGIPISIELLRNESVSGNGTLSPNVVSKNYIFPSDVEGKGKVTWYAYDEEADVSDSDKLAAACEAVTVVDKAALANGYIKGLEAGKAVLFAEYEDETGYKWPTQQQYEIEVKDRTTYDVLFDEMPDIVLANEKKTVENAVMVIINASESKEADTSEGTIEWDVDDDDVAAVTSERSASGELTTAIIVAKKAGTIKVKARYTDKDGVSSAWSEEQTITVKPNPYEIKMFNGKGELLENVPTLDVKAGKAISPDLYLTVSKNGAPVKLGDDDGFDVVSTNGILVKDSNAKFDKHLSGNKILSGNELYQLSGNAATNLMDTKNVRVALRIDNSEQFLEIPVRNYYTLTFDGAKSVAVSGNDFTLSECNVNVAINKKASGGLQSVPQAETPANKDNTKTIDIYAKDLTNGTYNLNLDNWSAVYMNDETGDKTGIVFAGWTEAVKSPETPVKTTLDKVKTGEYPIKGVGSDLVIAPQFKWAPVKNISTDGSTIKIEMTVTGDEGTAPTKSFKIATSPSKTGIKVLAETETELSDDIDGFYKMGDGTENPVNKKSIELTGKENGNYRESILTIHTKPGMIGTDTIKISAGNPDVVKNISLNIYGLHKVNVEGEEKIRYKNEDGTLAKKTAVKLTDNTTKYFDEDGNKFDNKYYGTVWNEKQELILLMGGSPSHSVGALVNLRAGGSYYVVSSNGLVAVSSLKTVSGFGTFYFGPDGKMVTYAETVKNGTPGKYTDGEKSYDIDKNTNEAKLSHDHAWKDVWDWTGTNEYGYKVKVTVSCNICGESNTAQSTTDDKGNDIKVTTDASSAESVTYKASVSFNSITYKSDKTVPKHKHTWKFEGFDWNVVGDSRTHDVNVNEVTAVFKCSVSADHINKEVSENNINVTDTVKSLAYGSGSDRVTRLIAIVNTNPDKKEEPHREERYYSVSANGDLVKVTKEDFDKAAESRIPGTTPSEPSESEVASYKSYNLFLTDNEIEVPGLDEALDAAGITALTGKAGLYFKVAGDDKVELRTPISAADRKNAAKAVNSLIKIDIPADEDGNGGGTFTYQLPVYYQKPVLKLTSTKGTVNIAKTHTDGTGKNAKEVVDDQYFTTTVTEKKSTGAFEPLDLEGLDNLIFVPSGKNGQVEGIFANTNVMGEIVITANAKTAGNISIKLYNWSEPVLLKYSVAKATKDVLTGSTKTILMNSNAAKGDAVQYDQNFTLYVNGNVLSAYENKNVSVIYPSNWINSGLELKGVANGMLTDNTVTVSFMGDAAQYNKGNYKVKFVTGSGKTKSIYSLKITVSDLALKDKAVNLKTQAKMDLTTGQRMVLIPQLKGISGEISNVEIDEKSAELFECEYNGLLNQIYLSPKDVSKLSIKTRYSVTVNLDVAGVTCSKTINFKPAAKTPTVKIAAVSLKKADFGKRELKAYTNVLATYKVQGKTFSVAPTGIDGVMFTNNKTVKLSDEARTEANLEGEDWYLDGKTNAYVRYDAESGKIEIVTTTSSKTGSVKVRVTFAGGKKVNKSFSIKKVK